MNNMSIRILSLLCFVLFSIFVRADNISVVSSRNDSIKENIQNFDPYVATQKYLDTLSPEKKAQSDAYFVGGYWLIIWNMVADIIVAFIFLSFGISKWIKKIAFKVKYVNLQNLIYVGFFILLYYILNLPLYVYQDFFREHQYNLSNLTFGGWFKEELIGLSLAIIMGGPLIMFIYIAIRKVRQNWWIWGSIISFIFMVTGSLIFPIFISPLFNEYKPLPEGKLKNEILSIARANGVPATEVYQFDASKQSPKISAYVAGFGSTTRICLNDNLLNKCTTAEIREVMGHETGHYVLNHIYKSLIFFGLLIFLGFYFVNKAYDVLLKRWGKKWNISDLSDIGGLPLLVLLFALLVFLATPISNNITRTMEIEADYFGINAAREPDASASVAMKLSTYRKINPGYWEEIIFYDHPSGKTRVLNAMKWKAEHLKIP